MPTFGKPAMVSWNGDRLDVFLKSKSRTLIHAWLEGGADGAMDLGGDLDSDPVAVARGDQVLDVFARSGDRLLQWQWDTELCRMVKRPPLPGFVVSNPVAAASDLQKLLVFAQSLDGPLRIWESSRNESGTETWWFPWTKEDIGGPPVVVKRGHELAVFIGSLVYWSFADGDWADPIRLGEQGVHGEAVCSAVCSEDRWGFPRLDVYTLDKEGQLWHWGFSEIYKSNTTSGWFEHEKPPGIAHKFPFDPVAVSQGRGEMNLFYRDDDSTLRHWSWHAPNPPYSYGKWINLEVRGRGLASDPVAISRAPGHLDVVAQAKEDALLHWSWNGSTWTQRSWPLSIVEPAEPQEDTIADTADVAPDYLFARPADHVLIGLSTHHCGLVHGQPPKLVAEYDDARLVVTFPPQHIAEQVSKPGDPPIDVWQARLSGPSRVAYEVRQKGQIELTGEGVLASLNGAKVSPNEDRSAIELPFGLIVSPQGPESGETGIREPVITRHPAQPVDFSGNVGLWRTRFGTAKGDGGLAVKGVQAGRPDPFPVALTKANRLFVSKQSTPASAGRLELSSLGGSLTASGKWDNFEWDHHAVLGRDQVVRTVTKGVLYPLGHTAVFVEMTERSSTEPIAVLRKTRTLYVIEAVRGQTAESPALKHGFPFSEVEVTTLEYSDLDDAVYQTIPRKTQKLRGLEDARDQANSIMDELHRELHNEMGYLGGLVTEDLAVLSQEEEVRELAIKYLELYFYKKSISAAIDTLQKGLGTEYVDTFFAPTVNGTTVRFPVRCRNANRDVHFDLPLLFVADLTLSDNLRESFYSLSDPTVAEKLREFYGKQGVVVLPGVPINMTPGDGASASSDVLEVHRLNIVGNQWRVGFRPSLGRADDPKSWGAEIKLPTMRTLLGRDPQVLVKFAPEYLSTGTGELAIKVLGEVVPGSDNLKPLDVNFSARSDRSGGLIAPNSVATGIHRVKGLVNVDGLQNRDAKNHLYPAKLFSKDANLFGFPLKELVQNIDDPPEIVTILTEGQPPTVRMTWSNIPLRMSENGAFEPLETATDGVTSRLNLKVESSPISNVSTCTITNFKLVMPPSKPTSCPHTTACAHLIEIFFDSVTFTQKTGQPPSLSIKLRNPHPVSFVGKLKLLQALQDAVGLGDLGPEIEANPTDITARYAVPVRDVAAFSFVMSNLTFRATLRVPFNGEPVSLALGFASREKPFTLTVLMFGGGGYVDLEVIHTGLRRLEVSLQFGAAIAINFGVGAAEVHAFGGIRYALIGNSVTLTGFIHIGGSVELLGLISVSVEMRVELDYQFAPKNRLVGRAKLVIEIDLTLFSESVELDSGEWVIAGGAERALPPPGRTISRPVRVPRDVERAAVDAWRRYREAFA